MKNTPDWEHYGRPKAVPPDNFDEVMNRWLRKEITAVAAMNLTGLKKTTFYKLADQYKKEN